MASFAWRMGLSYLTVSLFSAPSRAAPASFHNGTHACRRRHILLEPFAARCASTDGRCIPLAWGDMPLRVPRTRRGPLALVRQGAPCLGMRWLAGWLAGVRPLGPARAPTCDPSTDHERPAGRPCLPRGPVGLCPSWLASEARRAMCRECWQTRVCGLACLPSLMMTAGFSGWRPGARGTRRCAGPWPGLRDKLGRASARARAPVHRPLPTRHAPGPPLPPPRPSRQIFSFPSSCCCWLGCTMPSHFFFLPVSPFPLAHPPNPSGGQTQEGRRRAIEPCPALPASITRFARLMIAHTRSSAAASPSPLLSVLFLAMGTRRSSSTPQSVSQSV